MQAVFEKIIEHLENASFWTDSSFDEDGYCNDDSEEAVYLHKAIEIVKQEAEQYTSTEHINCSSDSSTNGWIPVSERLPDDFMSFEYLTTRKCHTFATISYYCVANRKWYSSRDSSEEIEVIAWQPLPQPYTKGD